MFRIAQRMIQAATALMLMAGEGFGNMLVVKDELKLRTVSMHSALNCLAQSPNTTFQFRQDASVFRDAE